MKRLIWSCFILGLLAPIGWAQLTVDDTKDAAERQQKEAPKAVREGLGWGALQLGTTSDQLVTMYGEPDEINGNEWSWANTGYFSCLINEQNVAYQLNFFEGFNYPLSSGIQIGSAALKSLGRYGVPENVEDRDGLKYYCYPKKGIIIQVAKKTVVGFSIIDSNTMDTNPIKPVYIPGEEIVETNVAPAIEEVP